MTPVSIGELNTHVSAEPAAAAATSAASAPAPWEELDRARRAAAELERLRERTSAEGFDA